MTGELAGAAPGQPDRTDLSRRIGAHAPTAGGLTVTLSYVDLVGAEAVQIFVSNPRGWAQSAGSPQQDEAFRAGCHQRHLPVYVHAPLLVNLGSPNADTVARSAGALAHSLSRGAALGARAVVFHAGSAVDDAHTRQAMRRVREALLPLLDRVAHDGGPRLLVEPSAGGGRSLAARVEQLAEYLDAVDWHPALGVCFDTCHAWAAGHDVATAGGMTATLDALVATVGADRLALVHANDSRDARGSLRDRHESIGQGAIGHGAFAELLSYSATAGVPVVVETPTVKHEGHAADIACLKRLRATATPAAARLASD